MGIILCDWSKFPAIAFKVLQIVSLDFCAGNDDCNQTIHSNHDEVISGHLPAQS